MDGGRYANSGTLPPSAVYTLLGTEWAMLYTVPASTGYYRFNECSALRWSHLLDGVLVPPASATKNAGDIEGFIACLFP